MRVWDLASGRLEHTLKGHTGGVNAVAVTPDGQRIVSGSDDHTVRVWDLASGRLERTLKGHTGAVNTVAVTPDGQHIVSGSDDGTVRVWDLASRPLSNAPVEGHTGRSWRWRSPPTASASSPAAATAPCGSGTWPADASNTP